MRSTDSRASPFTVILVALVLSAPALVVMTAPAVAQTTTQNTPDPYVKELYYSPSPVVGKPSTVTAVIGNKGDWTFGGESAPFRVCFYWNVTDQNSCNTQSMDSSFSLQQADTRTTSNHQSSTVVNRPIPPGGEVRVEMTGDWIPNENRPSGHPQSGTGKIIVAFTTLTPGPRELSDRDLVNNEKAFTVTVQRVGVTLTPDYARFLRADEIDVSCPSANQDRADGNCLVKPGQRVRFQLTVRNLGNLDDRFTLYHYGTGTGDSHGNVSQFGCDRDFRRCDWNVTFSSSAIVVPAQGESKVTMTVQVPFTGDKAAADHAINRDGTPETAKIKVRAVSLTSPEKFSDTWFPRLKVDTSHAVNLTTWEPIRHGNISKEIRFNFSVGNPGNGADQYAFEFVKSKSEINATKWNVAFPESVAIGPFRNETTAFSVVPPPRTPIGQYNMTIRVYSLNDRTNSTYYEERFTAIVSQHYALSYRLENQHVYAPAAEPTVYPLLIRNEGNGPDHIRFNKTFRVPPGWSVTLENEREGVHIPANTSRVVNLTVVSPPGERDGRVAFVNVTGVSSGPERTPRIGRPSVNFTTATETLRAPNFFVEPRARQLTGLFVDPNQTLTFDVRVRNVGNIWDNITFAKDHPLGWDVKVTPERLTLAPPNRNIRHATEATATVSITAPRSADVGEEASIFVRAESEVNPALRREVDFGFRISGPDLAVSGLSVDKRNVYAGDPANITLTVSNLGNKAPLATPIVRVLYDSGGTERLVAERTLPDLGGGASRSFDIPWNTSGLAGAGTLIARVDPAEAVVEIDETNNERVLSDASTFVRLFDLRLMPATGITARAGEDVLYQESPNAFIVQNYGNQMEPVRVTIRSSEGWFEPLTETHRVGSGEDVVLGFEFTVPDFPGVAQDQILVTVVPDLRPGAPLTATARTRLMDDAPPVIQDVRVTPAAPTVGTVVTLSARVTDALGLADVSAILRTPLEDSEVIPLERQGGGDTWTATRTLDVIGEYVLHIEAVDASANANAADTTLAPVHFTVEAGSAPTITPVTDLSRPVRAGTPIAFSVTDANLEVARIWYVRGGETHEVPLSGVVDTTGWTAGSVTFEMHAENAYGAQSVEAFTVTVDNTPPTLGDVTLDPAKPKPGKETTIRVSVDETVESVEIVVKRDEEVVDRLTAQKVSTGTFEAKYTPGAGRFTFDVVAKDAAGNTNTLDSSVQFTATGFPVPAPGAVAGLAALGAAAVLAAAGRRRRA